MPRVSKKGVPTYGLSNNGMTEIAGIGVLNRRPGLRYKIVEYFQVTWYYLYVTGESTAKRARLLWLD